MKCALGTNLDYFTPALARVKKINKKVIASEAPSKKGKTLHEYCLAKKVHPQLIVLNMFGRQDLVLEGAFPLIEQCRPVVIVRCDQSVSGRPGVLRTLGRFKQLGYRGFFILDTLKIPVSNFDFNLYQNPGNNFYCDQFIFEH